jgi:hypothetical protein
MYTPHFFNSNQFSLSLTGSQKNKVYWILLFVSLSLWLISVSQTKIVELNINGMSPFQSLPFYYWIALFIIIILIFSANELYLKIALLFSLCLMVFGTLPILAPYGAGSQDSYAIASFSKLLFKYGNINFGYTYTESYPTAFLFIGIFQAISNISVIEIIRFFPLIVGFSVLFGFIFIIKQVFKIFNLDLGFYLSTLGVAFISFSVFMFSLGVRVDPVPQSIVIVLIPFFLATFLIEDVKMTFCSLILYSTIATTHLTTSFICLFYIFFLNLFFLKGKIQKIVFPLIIWSTWLTFLAIQQFSHAISFFQSIYEFESNVGSVVDKSTGVVSASKVIAGDYILFRQVFLIITFLLIIISIYALFRYQRKILFLLFGLILCNTVYIAFLLLNTSEFSTRFFEVSMVFLALIMGFGIQFFLQHGNNSVKKMTSYSDSFAKIPYFVLIFLICCGSYFAVLTSNHSTVVTGFSYSQIQGCNFLIYSSNYKIFTYRPLAAEYPDYISVVSRETHGLDQGKKEFQLFSGIIGISNQWLNWQSIRKIDSLYQGLNWLKNTNTSLDIYENGNFKIFLKTDN